MKVLFADRTFCDFVTLQRLLLISDEVAFMDRPSVGFGDWGLVGAQSVVRRFSVPDDSPVRITVHEPPSGPAQECYQRYIERDFQNPAFATTFLQALADPSFAAAFITPSANYRSGTGQQVLDALLADPELRAADLTTPIDGARFFEHDTREGRVETLKSLLCEASVRVTSAMAVSERTGLLPVAEHPAMSSLLALRTSDKLYVHTTPRTSSALGLAVAQAVLPDEVLAKLTVGDVLDYRKQSQSAYQGFTVEIDRLADRLVTADPLHVDDEIKSLLATDVGPKVEEYHREMASVRDKMFGSLLKEVAKWEVPTLSVAQLAGLTFGQALAAFLGALTPAVPHLVDYVVRRREVVRANSFAYLIGVAPQRRGTGGA